MEVVGQFECVFPQGLKPRSLLWGLDVRAKARTFQKSETYLVHQGAFWGGRLPGCGTSWGGFAIDLA
jgi:hypothetical protein